ncbi:MAG: DUF4114 domain-containing protein [Deltaproteobacteria bacterium]|nr:DUF4114 domain-containing protein [Deltaproteobacteria bacterium]
MQNKLWMLFACFSALISTNASAAIETSFQTPDPQVLQQIHDLFPEGQTVSPALLDYQVNPNLHLRQEAEIQVTFLWEGAGLENSFGYCLYRDGDGDGSISQSEILESHILWSNASQVGDGGDLSSGATIKLGKFPSDTRMGFFLIADGNRQARETYYTLDALNPDGHRHLAMMATPDRKQILLGIEDLPWDQSDRDFNDLMFTVTANPGSALEDSIEEGHIPGSATPTPSPTPDIQGFPEKRYPLAEPQIAPSAPPPPLLEGSGGILSCQLMDIAKAAKNYDRSHAYWIFMALGYLEYYLLRRKSVRTATSGRAKQGRTQQR